MNFPQALSICLTICQVSYLGFAGHARAQDAALAPVAELEACVSAKAGSENANGACLEQILAPCLKDGVEKPAVAILCFRSINDGFKAAAKARISAGRGALDERAWTVATIEYRYDVLSGMLQCQRLVDLAKAADDAADGDDIAVQAAQCETTTIVLSHLRFHALVGEAR